MTILISLGKTEIIIILLTIAVSVLALIDILRSRFAGNKKITWIIVVFCTGLIGAIVYLFVQKSQKMKDDC